MNRVLAVLLLLSSVYAGTDLNKFVGEWTLVAMYSAAAELRTCDRFNITLDGDACSCDGEPASALRFGMVALPIIVVEDYQGVAAALNRRCTSGGITKTMAARLVNDDFFVLYERCYECSEREPETANLMARRLPRKADLDALVGIDELRGRSGKTCGLVQ
ncbi:unnamed protein product, partial [Iphiclides podalirius]